ncbi:hypothetical protein Pla86_27600 [Planctomycetes bacterium Pla86]|uniref:Uncharacterized protein n=1 Tax=Engelhardtia mirabilis TaxID=2528011 RepID=A0A518BL44_9BACT|nr:hypothetical protein Pla133_27610 [Planctomycetes bacterium Pla133]QDV01999.1 hypothetical protein Pla86_27600 [Planctomycetes bacterium Pla86]
MIPVLDPLARILSDTMLWTAVLLVIGLNLPRLRKGVRS